MLKVSKWPNGSPEIFHSIQGEGVYLGKPAVFLRLSLRNLACSWCDTRYTWDWKEYDQHEQTTEMTAEQVAREILRHNCDHVVVTGGEPLIQQSELIPCLRLLKDRRARIEVETNGTIPPYPPSLELVDHWSVSPKLANSGNPQSRREVPECYLFFSSLLTSHFKYVIEKEEDLREIKDLASMYGLAPEKIVLMPQARTVESLLEKSRWLVETCKREGYRFSTRLHLLLWGDRRGV